MTSFAVTMEKSYALSPLQQGMLFHAISAPNSGVDIEQIISTLHEPLSINLFQDAWQTVIDRHDILRSRFEWQTVDQPQQTVVDHVLPHINIEDWRHLTPADQRANLEAFLTQDRLQDFDLTKAPLMRIQIFHCAEDLYQCVWTFHHILLDGRSFPLVLTEVFNTYDALQDGRTPHFDTPKPYREYIHWLSQRDLTADETYWRNTLKGFSAPTPLPSNQTTPTNAVAHANGLEEATLTAELTEQLRRFAKAHGLTVNTLIQGAWSLLLHHYSGEEDVVFGATRACRHSALDGALDMIGLFINTLPVRVQFQESQPLLSYLQELRQQSIDLRQHEHTPLPTVQKWSDMPRNMSLFDSLVVFENYLLNTRLQAHGGRWLDREFVYKGQTNYPLTLMGYLDHELLLRLEYDPQRFTQPAVQRMVGHMATLLAEMVHDPHRAAVDLPYLTAAEQQTLLNDWNDTAMPFQSELSVHQLISAQAQRTPSTIAAVCGAEQITYGELEARTNQLARYLQNEGVKPDTLVALCLNRSIDMLVGLLAIWKAGGAYVPLDPAYPKDRLTYMLSDAQVPLILTEAALVHDLPPHFAKTVCIDSDWPLVGQQDSRPFNNPALRPENLAYVIYTSGSTGKPKGVQVPHKTVNNFLTTMSQTPGLTAKDRLLAITTLSFDIAVLELYLPLTVGAKLIIATNEMVRDGRQLVQALTDHNITVMQATPSTWRMMIDAGWEEKLPLKILCGGEAFPYDLAQQLLTRADQVWNMYGPTETTVWSTCYQLQPAQPIYIGRPIGNTQCYVLDPHKRPVPVGVYGELYLGGEGVVRGYLGRPDLTAERFIPNPFVDDPHARMYKTGDLVRYQEDGRIEYLNRVDNQVKVHGFRIELGEIENNLATHPQILRNAVAVKTGSHGDKRLVAYLVTAENEEIPAEQLKQHLGAKLPHYMIPNLYIRLDALPLTNNGKINRKALPDVTSARPTLGTTYIAPRNELEKTIAAVWQTVLEINQSGIHDNFYDLGGNSLLVLPVISRLQQKLNVELTVVQLFAHPTISALAQHIQEKQKGENRENVLKQQITSRAKSRQAALKKRRAVRL